MFATLRKVANFVAKINYKFLKAQYQAELSNFESFLAHIWICQVREDIVKNERFEGQEYLDTTNGTTEYVYSHTVWLD